MKGLAQEMPLQMWLWDLHCHELEYSQQLECWTGGSRDGNVLAECGFGDPPGDQINTQHLHTTLR